MNRQASGVPTGVRPPLTFLASAVAMLVAMAPVRAEAKVILVIGTHPDDEVIMAAGRARTALTNGDTIKLVVVTNGDINGVTSGITREGNSVQSAIAVGLTEQDVIFFGYPDGSMRNIYDSTSGTQVFTSAAGQTATYGTRGLGGMEYHRYLTGAHASYNRNSVIADLNSLLTNFRPDEIYTHGTFENHNDHGAVALFIIEALRGLQRSGANLPTTLYQSIVWMAGSGATGSTPWPQLTQSGWTPLTPILPNSSPCAPGDCLDRTALEWSRAQYFLQPSQMQLTDITTNMKAVAIAAHQGTSPWYVSWTRKDEFFFPSDFVRNLALTATVTASSANTAGGQGAAKANDGVVTDYIASTANEWVTQGQLAGAWIQLDWAAPVRIAQVNLFDRPSTTENILSGTLSFSDGTSLNVGALPTNGRVQPVTFSAKTVSWVRFTVNEAQGNATGLAEIEVLGATATSTANNPPYFIRGPVAASDTITAAQTTTISAVGYDLDGDALQYQWSTEAGAIQGNGASAVFTPPAVSSDTYVAITVRLTDGRGGSATNSTFVRVTPAPASSISVSPTAVFSGNPAQGTVVLSTPAPSGGTVVPLTSSAPAVASVPGSVAVPAGSATASFAIGTGAVTTSTTVTISAAFATGTRSATLTVAPPSVSSLTLNPSNVLGGGSSQGTVTLPLAAGSQGAVVQLSTSNAAVASVPASVTVPAGTTTATFTVSTTAVAAATGVTISATYGSTANATLTVGPLALSTLSLNPTAVVGGSSSQGVVVLNGPASGSGALIALSSGDPTLASVPASVTVPAGADRASFTVSTATVTASATVSIGAAFAGDSRSAVLTVTPNQPNPNLLSSPEQIGAAPWNTLGTIALTLNYAAAPDGSSNATRAVVSSSAGHALRQPATVTAGTTYTFSFFAQNNGGPAASYAVFDQDHFANIVAPTSYISQLTTSSYKRVGVTFTVPAGCSNIYVYVLRDSGGPVDVLVWGAKLEVGPNMTGYQFGSSDSLAINPTTVTAGGTVQGTVTLAAVAPAGGTSVPLSSSNPGVASVPASVTVPGGAATASFTVTTSSVSSTTTITLSAAFASGTRTTTLTVTPALAVSSVALNPTSVVGGSGSQGTVTLNGPAGAGGAIVTLSSDNAAATVAASVTVAAGSTTTTFPVSTSAVSTSTAVTISAANGGVTRTAVLTVSPPALSTLTTSPTSVVGGTTSTGTVTLTGPAPGGGTAVSLGSSDPGTASVPASTTVPAGATTATFTVSTASAATATSVTLSATLGSITRTTALTVMPALALSTLALNPTSVVGGSGSTGTATLNAPASGTGAVVSLASDNSAATVPATVTVAAGSSSATFLVTTSGVATSTAATISAAYGGVTRTAVLTVSQADIATLSLNPTSVVGGNPSTGTVTLNGPAPGGGTQITLASNDSATATVPASVTVLAGDSTASFAISTTTVTSARTVTISASTAATTRTAVLTVTTQTPSNPNLLSNPEQIGVDPWGTLGSIAVTPNYATAPDGTVHATRAVVTTTTGHALRQPVIVSPGATYTLSFFARNNGGTAAAYSVFDQDHFANIIAPTSYISQINGSAFTRVNVTFTVPAGCTNIFVYVVRDSGGPVDILFWGAKLEVGATMTAYP